MLATSTGQFFAQTLAGYGTTHVFLVPAIFNTAMAALEETGIRRVTTHHEIAAAYMADGYARASQQPGICLAQAVGSANLAAGLRDAFLASSPVIAITGGAHPTSRYRHLYQIVEDFPMFEPVTKLNARLDRPDRLPDLLRQAFRVATTGAPGPVHLELPGRLGEAGEGDGQFEVLVEESFRRYPAYRPQPDAGLVAKAVSMLARAERPVIVAGGGVVLSQAAHELRRLAERLSIPVATTPNGKEVLPEDHPLNLGMVGAYGRPSCNRIVAEADLVFFAGSRAGGLATNNWRVPRPGTTAIQLDLDPAEIGRNYLVQVGLFGDAQVTLQRMLEAAPKVDARAEWLARAQDLLVEWRKGVAPRSVSGAVPIRPERICHEVGELLPEDAVLVSDTGHAAMWTGMLVPLRYSGQRYIRCSGTLGWALPASLGVKCALPERPVLCFTGDGGAYYHLAELETAARHGINVVVLVNDNAALQQPRQIIERAYRGAPLGRGDEIWRFGPRNLAAVAESLGCLGLRVEHPDELRGALETALRADRPALVDVVSDLEAWPPVA